MPQRLVIVLHLALSDRQVRHLLCRVRRHKQFLPDRTIMKNSLKLVSFLFLTFSLFTAYFYFSHASSSPASKEAMWYEKLGNGNVHCRLCPRQCLIRDGQRGFCGVRENQSGTLFALSYGKAVSLHIDPIEKKPLFHFYPGSNAFSIATAGCNLRCSFCQNWEISQKRPEDVNYSYIEPKDVIEKMKAIGASIIAYTYTEPTIFYEYMLETAKLARKEGFKNVMHSCGYVNEKPLRELAKYLDAANIDLKSFNDEYYKKMSEATLEPVLAALKILKEEGVHLEITTLILPGFNDSIEEITKMCTWIYQNLGSDTPLHFSRFYPMYKLLALNPTPVATLEKARNIAFNCGLKYVYIGNIPGHAAENTYCPRCKRMIIERKGYFIAQQNVIEGKCKFCGEKIDGVWN
jgi:pyruvate formate lyase activating enzyme